ncbi:hypothetical protein GPECTOR_8g21 [Gonium pectorale]|uniref:Uncharacterized protein n=1 Tax=Gonium pectorale TaxID=33097 RepID=A0A150GSJ3_GONPE|nr:hypothetical protein GPECTOR_8g21 [Gonium pectorale]|eukprot:KXZ52826.1 hypothetical protein GPECTOR_8g21 [Gonium pectorale]
MTPRGSGMGVAAGSGAGPGPSPAPEAAFTAPRPASPAPPAAPWTPPALPVSVEDMLAGPSMGPAVLAAARVVAGSWAAAQEREWYRGQLALRQDRVTQEAERLLQSAIGPLGLDPSAWRKLPERVEAVARRNVMREEARELERLRLEQWHPQVLAASATAAVRTALAEARDGGRSGSDGGGEASAGAPSLGDETECGKYGPGDGDGSGGGSDDGGGATAGEAGSPLAGGGGVQAQAGSVGPSTRRLTWGKTPRYMDANAGRNRLRKALGQLVAKHAGAAGVKAYTAGSSSAVASAPATPGGGSGGGGTPFAGDDTAAAAAAVAAGDGGSPGPVGRRRGSANGTAVGGAGMSTGGGALQSSAALRARRAAEREARWAEEAKQLASRVAGYLDLQSPVKGARIARAAAGGCGGPGAGEGAAAGGDAAGPGVGAGAFIHHALPHILEAGPR